MGIYSLASVLFFARDVVGAFQTTYIGFDTDPSESMWFIRWWPYAIQHRLHPFYTNLIWAPRGINLSWGMTIPLPALAVWPLAHTFGLVAAYNSLVLAAPALAAFATFLLCQSITKAYWPSMLGGFIFGFSPYMLGQILGHANLVMTFPIPLFLLLTLAKVEGKMNTGVFMTLLTLLLLVEALCSLELLATATFFGGVALLLAMILFPHELRLEKLIGPIVVAYALALIAISPYIYTLIASGDFDETVRSTYGFSADIVNFIVPTRLNLLGTVSRVDSLTQRFSGNILENGACLTIPLLVVTEAWRRNRWQFPKTRLCYAMLFLVCVAALGPVLHVDGVRTIAMPWILAQHLPLISAALPVRFTLYAFLILAIVVASWLADPTVNPWAKRISAVLIVIFMLPNPDARFWRTPIQMPALFQDGGWRNYIAPGEIILPLPLAQKGISMLWQAYADMQFRMACGYVTRIPFELDQFPIVHLFRGAIDLPEAGEQLKAFIASHEVSVLVIDPHDPNVKSWLPVVSNLGIAPTADGGALIYRIPHGKFAAYGKLPREWLESRALALRFDAILEATAAYLASGHQLKDLSAFRLKNYSLLPDDWKVDVDPLAFDDYAVGPLPGGHIGIAMMGSYRALQPIAERYRDVTSRIQFPLNYEWRPRQQYSADSTLNRMLFEFTAAALAKAASNLRASPPAEKTTSFLAAVPDSGNPGN